MRTLLDDERLSRMVARAAVELGRNMLAIRLSLPELGEDEVAARAWQAAGVVNQMRALDQEAGRAEERAPQPAEQPLQSSAAPERGSHVQAARRFVLHRLSQGPAPVAEMTHGLMELLGMDRKKADGLVRHQLEAMKDKIDYRGKGHLAQLMPGAAGKAVLSVASRSKSGGVWNIEGTDGRMVRLSRGQEKRGIRLSSLQTGHAMLGGQHVPKDFLDRIPSLP